MVQAVGARGHIEEDLQASKDLGLDQDQVRSYLGWYRHTPRAAGRRLPGRHLCAGPRAAWPSRGRRVSGLIAAECAHPLRSAAPAGTPHLACAHLGPIRLRLVAVAAHPAVLGRLVSSSSSHQSPFLLNAGGTIHVSCFSSQDECSDLAGENPWICPWDLSGEASRDKSQENLGGIVGLSNTKGVAV